MDQFKVEPGMMRTIILVTIWTFSLMPTKCLIAYNCDTYKNEDLMRFSSTKVEECPTDLKGWYQTPQPIELQIIRIPKVEKMKISKCVIEVETVAHYCGNVDSIAYSGPIVLGKNERHIMSIEDCQNLVRYGEFNYKGHSFQTDKRHFSKDFVVQGDRNEEAGSCTHSATFTSHGKKFTHSLLRNIVSVWVYEDEEITYNSVDQEVTLDGSEVPITLEGYRSTMATFVWRDPTRDCRVGKNMREGYYGAGTLYIPNNPNLPQMVLVNSKETEQTFGLELRSQERECNFKFYGTQLSTVKVSLNTTNDGHNWRIPSLRSETLEDVNPEDNLNALVGHNFVVFTSKTTDALADLSRKSCQNKREATLADLTLMRIDTEVGIQKVFGRGVNGFLRGGDIYIYQCQTIEVEYREVPEDHQDMPISFIKDGVSHIGFMDANSWKLKQTSIVYPNLGILPVSYDFQGSTKCKLGATISCDRPLIMTIDTEKEEKALIQKDQKVHYDGGLDDRQKRDAMKRNVDLKSDIEANSYGFGKAVYNPHTVEAEKEIFDLFDLEFLQLDIFDAAWLANWSDYLIQGAVVLSIAVAIIMMIIRCRKLRNSKSDDFKNAKSSYVNACVNPPKFYNDLHLAEHQLIKDEFEPIRIVVVSRSEGLQKSSAVLEELDDSGPPAAPPVETSAPPTEEYADSHSTSANADNLSLQIEDLDDCLSTLRSAIQNSSTANDTQLMPWRRTAYPELPFPEPTTAYNPHQK